MPATTGSTSPIGVAHGFLALEPLQLVYLVTNEYDGTDELGFAWDDPASRTCLAGAPGHAGRAPILSERDRSNPSLARPDGASARHGVLTRTPPHRTGTHRTRSEGTSGAGTIPRLRAIAPRARLARHTPVHPRPCRGAQFAQVRRRPRPRPARESWRSSPRSVPAAAGDPKVVIIVGATHGTTPAIAPTPIPRTPRPGPTPRTSSRSTARTRRGRKVKAAAVGRIDRHLLGARQRLAQPVHVRPELHDQGRFRAQRDGRRGRLQQQVLRRAVCGDPGPRAGRDRAAPPPVLRLGQLRAPGTPPPSVPGRAPARRQLRCGVPEGRRVGRHRRRPRAAPRATCGPCSRPTSRSRLWRDQPNPTTT